MRDGCGYPAIERKRLCHWHWLMKQPMPVQIREARNRALTSELAGAIPVTRMPKSVWPEGERFCAGCQDFVPLFYCSGSVCKAHASEKRHEKLLRDSYGMTPAEYQRLLDFQGGVCFICRRPPRNKRLAVDHDHETGLVRGLLCADNENGCNRAVIGNLERAVDGGLAAAKRAVDYLDYPPAQRLR